MGLPTYVVLSLVAGLLLRSTTGSVGKLIEMDDLKSGLRRLRRGTIFLTAFFSFITCKS